MDDFENSNPELIYLTDGASKGVMQMLNTVIRNDKDGVWWICLNLKTNLVRERERERSFVFFTLKKALTVFV